MRLTVILLPDTSPKVGLGHFYRCLRLGIALREAGHRPIIVGAPFSKAQLNLLQKHRLLKRELSGVGAGQVIRFLEEFIDKPSWIVTDHYRLSEKWERKIRPFVCRISVFDDADGRNHDCDLLINGALSLRTGRSYYSGRVSHRAFLLLGPRYGLPDPQLKAPHSTRKKERAIRTICFFLGGSASLRIYERYLTSLLKELPDTIEQIICIPPIGTKLSGAITTDPRVSVVTEYSKLNESFKQADLFIGSGGAISYDRIVVGVPGVVMSMAENQGELSRYLAKLGTQRYLGNYRSVSPRMLVHHVNRLIGRIRVLNAMRSRCRGVVDGRGAERIVTELRKLRRSS